jgi:hypothetical protein
MIDVNEIAKKDALDMKQISDLAKQFIVELNGEQDQLQVEEITLSENEKKWFVTVGYFRRFTSPNDLQKALGLLGSRVYKRVIVDRETYHVIGMQDWSYNRQEAA